MALEVVGSSPTTHPTFLLQECRVVGVSPSGKARDFDSRIRKVRILPPQPFDPLAQLVEHLTFNQGAWGSNPQWVTILDGTCGCGGMADAADLGSVAQGV